MKAAPEDIIERLLTWRYNYTIEPIYTNLILEPEITGSVTKLIPEFNQSPSVKGIIIGISRTHRTAYVTIGTKV